MIIFHELGEIENIEPTVVALGNFDGIHRGHRALVDTAVADAKAMGIKSGVFTFSNHPKNAITGKQVVKNIIYQSEKEKILEDAGIDYLFSIPFDEKMQHMEPESFIYDLFLNTFKAKEAVCGFNYRFGHMAKGDYELLITESRRSGFKVKVVNAVTVNDNVVSSTLIRELINAGKMDEIPDYLGRYYSINGRVIHGNELGRTLGFPTANITADDTMVMPPNGVYVTECTIDGNVYESITNVGNKPTIGVFTKNIETNILGKTGMELYGKNMEVRFLSMVRPERRFQTVDSLKKQIDRDCRYAEKYHLNRNTTDSVSVFISMLYDSVAG